MYLAQRLGSLSFMKRLSRNAWSEYCTSGASGSSCQSRNVCFNSETPCLRWIVKFRNGWGQKTRFYIVEIFWLKTCACFVLLGPFPCSIPHDCSSFLATPSCFILGSFETPTLFCNIVHCLYHHVYHRVQCMGWAAFWTCFWKCLWASPERV